MAESGTRGIIDRGLEWMDAPDLRYDDGEPLLPEEGEAASSHAEK